MSRRRDRGSTAHDAEHSTRARRGRPLAPTTLALAWLALAAAIAGSAVLMVSHLPGYTAPGCGPDGGCEKLKTSPFGVVPGTQPIFPEGEPPLLITDQAGWPTAYLGLAFFLAVGAALAANGARPPHALLRWTLRVGALASLGYIAVMLASRTLCPWCLAVHLANFVLLAAIEFGPRRAPQPGTQPRAPRLRAPILAALAAFAISSAAVGMAHNEAARSELASADQGIDKLLDDIAQDEPDDNDPDDGANPQPPDSSASPPSASDAAEGDTENDAADPAADQTPAQIVSFEPAELGIDFPVAGPERPGAAGFTGRYRIGAPDARVRIVTFSSVMCPHCRTLDREIRDIMAEHPGDVSLSVKHFPLNSQCNPVGGDRAQPGSCEAAYTLEAAGLLGGPEAYWAMKTFVYDTIEEEGGVSGSAVRTFIRDTLGIPLDTFSDAFNLTRVREWVSDDIQQGIDLGVTGTPAVFINGQVFQYWHIDGALSSAVERALRLPEARLPRTTSAADTPPTKARNLWDNWLRRSGAERRAHDPQLPSFTADDRPVTDQDSHPLRLVAFFDYTADRAAPLDAHLRDITAEFDRVMFQPRVAPMASGCNPFTEIEGSPTACRAARVMVTVRELADSPEAVLLAHDWLLANRGRFTDEERNTLFQNAGLDPIEAAEFSTSVRANNLIVGDIAAMNASMRGLRAPAAFLNGRPFVPLEFDGQFVVRDVVSVATRDILQNPERYTPEQMTPIRAPR